MRLRPHVLGALIRKDASRLLHNGPALMLLGLFVLVAILVASSGLLEAQTRDTSASQGSSHAAWIVYWEPSDWIEHLKFRAPEELAIRFIAAGEVDTDAYPPNICVIELRPLVRDPGRQQIRHHVQYRFPGSDPSVLWPVTRWFLSASIEHFAEMPQFFETIKPLAPVARAEAARAALERTSIADVLSPTLIGVALLTSIQFFAACGLLVSLTAQERERGALRALLLTPATYGEFVVSKAMLHGGLALSISAIVMTALQPAVLNSVLFWSTTAATTCGYFAVGLLIASFANNQTAPNLLSFAYLLLIGTLNLLGSRLEAFQFLSALTFERYGLLFTLASLNNPDISAQDSLNVLRSTGFRMLTLLSVGLLCAATFVGSRRLRSA